MVTGQGISGLQGQPLFVPLTSHRTGTSVEAGTAADTGNLINLHEKILRLALRDSSENVALSAIRHLDVLVPPPGDIDVEDSVRTPIRGHDLGWHNLTIEGLLERDAIVVNRSASIRHAIGEVIQRHVPRVVQHRLSLWLKELGKAEIAGVLVLTTNIAQHDGSSRLPGIFGRAGVVPVHLEVVVMNTLDQRVEEAFIQRRIRVVIANLIKPGVILIKLAADLDPRRAHLLGDGGLFIGDSRHLNRANRHLLIADNSLDFIFDGGDDRHQQHTIAADVGVSSQMHLPARTGLQVTGCLHHALPDDPNQSVSQLSERYLTFKQRPPKVEIYACIEMHVTSRLHQPGNTQLVAGIDQNAAVSRLGLENAVHINGRCCQMHQRISLDDGVLAGNLAQNIHALTRLQEGSGFLRQGEDVAAKCHGDAVGHDADIVAGIDQALDHHIARNRDHINATDAANVLVFTLNLTNHALQQDVAGRAQTHRATVVSIKSAATLPYASLVQYNLGDHQGSATGVSTCHQIKCSPRTDQAIHKQLTLRFNARTGARVCSIDDIADQYSASCKDVDSGRVSANQHRLSALAQLAACICTHGGCGPHHKTKTSVITPGTNAQFTACLCDRSRIRQIKRLIKPHTAHNHCPGGTDVQPRVLACPPGLTRCCIKACPGKQCTAQHHVLCIQRDPAGISRRIHLGISTELHTGGSAQL